MAAIKFFVMVDVGGEYEIGTTSEEASTRFSEEITDDVESLAMAKLYEVEIDLPTPKPTKVKVNLPVFAEKSLEVAGSVTEAE